MVDSEDRYTTEKASSVQSTILNDCEAEALSKSIHPRQSDSSKVKWRYSPELVQFHGLRSVEVLLDTLPGSPKNCPEARGDQSSPLQSCRQLGFGQVLSDQPAASRLEHCRSPGCDVDTTGPMPYRLDYEYWLILS
ncbi:hypothetical protein F2Q70_00025132 [Brassica cretica]|uniref:Uncharacterized protein n=1 Tax=Brassica cretica TaxID=69181 RepID=A0A8S9L5U6_BRACR|nr:hypothetical protein F2Q70_00025132 [Brassica cretica]